MTIRFLTTSRHAYTIEGYLADIGKNLTGQIVSMSYSELFWKWRRLKPIGDRESFIFADIERLSKSERRRATQIREKFCNQGCLCLNDPSVSWDRYSLLTNFHEIGINQFQIKRLNENLSGLRYPVFLRCAEDHRGSKTDLIFNENELRKQAFRLRYSWGGRRVNAVIEHVDTRDQTGIYRKYSAMRVGDTIIPRHLFFSDHWHVKTWKDLSSHLLDEEMRYIDSNPHESELRRIFDLANIQFGRIDYGVVDGRIQVWEINTNPMLPVAWGDGGPARKPVRDFFHPRFEDALARVDFHPKIQVLTESDGRSNKAA